MAELRTLLAPGEAVDLYAISIDDTKTSRSFAEKLAGDGKGPVPFQILSDPKHEVIDSFGIRNHDQDGERFEGIPKPAVYVIDKTGRVTWSKIEEDYRKRPSNAEVRAALDALSTKE